MNGGGNQTCLSIFMRIAPHYRQPAEIREAQLKTWRESGLKNVGMAVVVNAADSTDIHPRNKRVAGERLTLMGIGKAVWEKSRRIRDLCIKR